MLTPQTVDPTHPFPFISNLSDSLAIALRAPGRSEPLFARVKIPHMLPGWVELTTEAGEGRRFASVREIIREIGLHERLMRLAHGGQRP